MAKGIADVHGAEVEFTVDHGFPVTVNDGRVVDLSAEGAAAVQ